MKIEKINPLSMKQPTKAYSNGILVDLGSTKMLFVTGQLSQDNYGVVIAPNDYERQARYIFGHIEEILADCGMTFDDVVKAQIFLKDIHQSQKVSAVRDEVFKKSQPASTMIQVGGFVKDDCCVEIEVIAIK